MLLKKMKKITLADDKQLTEKKLKKIKKNCETNREEPVKSSKRKSSRKCKTVRFSETTTTKYYTTETDTSFDSELSSLRDENSNESGSLERESLQDEQSECGMPISNELEEKYCNLNDLSKAERKRLKRLKNKQKNNTTERFLKSVSDTVSDSDLVNDDFTGIRDVNLKKRKFYSDDSEYSDSKRSQSETESPHKIKIKKNKKKKKRLRRLEAKQLSSIVKSLNNVCRLSDNE